MIVLVYPGNPLPAPRPQVGPHGNIIRSGARGSGTYEQWRDDLAFLLRAQMRGRLPAPVAVRLDVWFYRSDKRRVDIDNLLKGVMDALNGTVVLDDSQVVDITAHKRYDKLHPRTKIDVTYAEQLRTCDYCVEGNVAIEGWHEYPDEYTGAVDRIPCLVNPPSVPVEVLVLEGGDDGRD